MEATFTFDEKKYHVTTKGATFMAYRNEFNRDMLYDLLTVTDEITKVYFETLKDRKDSSYISETEFIKLVLSTGHEKDLCRFLWASIKGYSDIVKQPFKSYKDFVSNIEDYKSFVLIAVDWAARLANDSKPTEPVEKTKKKSKTKKKGQNSAT